MIYLELTQSMFIKEFELCGRRDQFSYEALCAMYEYLDDLGEDFSLDVVALCCDFTEYTLKNFDEEEHLDEDNIAFEVRGSDGKLISYVVHC